MQRPEIILDIISQRSSKNLKIDKLYKYLYNTNLYIESYKKLSNNKLVSSSILNRINNIIDELKQERYGWNKQEYKKISFNNLTIDSWKDKLLQDIILKLLNSIYDINFYENIYSYRKENAIAKTLLLLHNKGQASEFFIRFDIDGCFEDINKQVLLDILKKRITDNRFIYLIQNMFKYSNNLFKYEYAQTYSNIPFSDDLSQLFLNIYLNELDQFILASFKEKYNKLLKREVNLIYSTIKNTIFYLEGKLKDNNFKPEEREKIIEKLLKLKKERQQTSVKRNINESNFRRFNFIRYSNNCIIPFIGTYNEALDILESIKNYTKNFLKTKIVNEKIYNGKNTKSLNFLQYNIVTQWNNNKIINKKRVLSGQIAFLIPDKVITEFKRKFMKKNKPIHISYLLNSSVFNIISFFQEEYKRLYQYYRFARNIHKLGEIRWILETSLTKTLAHKLKTHVSSIFKKFHGLKTIDGYSYKVIQTTILSKNNKSCTAYFGALPLKVMKNKFNIIIEDHIKRNIYSRLK